ncbi:MAG TPA: MFS transporter [Candidatus Binataceae bacterium]|nr:MFS transporter [Candidatus Binataceae bacterium]
MNIARRLTVLAYVCLLLLGIQCGWMGPFLPEISRTLHVAIDDAGLLISATATGHFAALLAVGAISHRRAAQHFLLVAMILYAVGLLGLALAPALPLMLLAAAIVGLGNGAIDIAANAVIVDLNRERLAEALNYLHVLFGIGAFIGPIIAGFALARAIGYPWVFGFGALGCAMVAAALLATPTVSVQLPAQTGDGLMPLLARPILWLLAGVLFLYVGGEAGVGAWLYLYLRSASDLAPAVASTGVSIYWLGLIAGRFSGARLANRIAARELTILASALSAIALIGLILAPRSHVVAAAMIFLIGLGYGPVFPNMVAIGASRFPHQVGRMSSIIIAGGALGAVFVPWLMGYAIATATPRASMEFALAVTVVMALLSMTIRVGET